MVVFVMAAFPSVKEGVLRDRFPHMLGRFLLLAGLIISAGGQDKPVIHLWPEGAPEKPGFKIGPEVSEENSEVRVLVRNVSDPIITLYKPEHANGTAILVCPGGGYNVLAYGHEGTMVCDYLTTIGVTAVLLKYRVPRRDEERPQEAPLQDVQQALTLIRKNAAEWGIDPHRVGMMGFSAAGHLTAYTGLAEDENIRERPDFLVLGYPAYMTRESDEFALKPEFKVRKDSPPAFFAHAGNDPYSAMGSVLLYTEYKRAGVPAELHVYASGGHGFGMMPGRGPAGDWYLRCGEWLQEEGWRKPRK